VSVVSTQLGSLITRKRDEAALRESETKYRRLVERAAEAILLIAPDGTVAAANDRAGELFGARPGDLIGRDQRSFLAPDDRGVVPPIPVLQLGEILTAEYWVLRDDGARVAVEASAALLPDGHVQAIVRDISGRKELERLKDEFVSVVSHELRTPLTSIRGSLGLLASGKLGDAPDKAQRMLDVAVLNTDRLIRLINDILDVERIESGTIAMDRRWCEAAGLMQQVAESLRPMADRAGVEIRVSGRPTRLWADADRITQALTNLVGNAIKFSPAGGAIDVSAIEADDCVRFEVRDRGRGIPASKLEAIFERFQQVDASDTREKGGTGLGLAISRTIVRQHGGRIWAASPPEGGSVFTFTIPLPAAPEVSPAADAGGEVAHRPMRILVIEDDETLAQVIAMALEARGFTVIVARDGAEALACYDTAGADLLVLDLALPDIGGLDVLERVRRRWGAGAPAIIYTAGDPDADARSRIRALGVEIATKGRVSTDALVERVARLLASTQPRPSHMAS
jgi:PAS domain S-box-containing protein